MRDTKGRFACNRVERRLDQLVAECGEVECIECQLRSPIGEVTLCGNCSQPVCMNGMCAAPCPFCEVLLCQLCIDTSPTGAWHVCIPLELLV